jgi:hypothetical protein
LSNNRNLIELQRGGGRVSYTIPGIDDNGNVYPLTLQTRDQTAARLQTQTYLDKEISRYWCYHDSADYYYQPTPSLDEEQVLTRYM